LRQNQTQVVCVMELDVRKKGTNPLSHYPDFSLQGYRVIRELGRNQEGKRITYLASVCHSEQQVVIKEFSFSGVVADLSGTKAYEREIEILQQLNHPRIPHYIDSFATTTSFCLVLEYKNASCLGLQRSFHPTEVKQIAISILEILVYLQQQFDPIIHRDIKPENILVDDQLNAYLVDFGLACKQGTKMNLSTLSVGTPGFIPPEEQFGYILSSSADLYSLGTTLICLLTDIHAANIGNFIDDQYRFQFQNLPSRINPRFRLWLRKMVEPNRKDRYADASEALATLKHLDVTGTTNVLETFLAIIKLRKRTAMAGLAIFGMLAIAVATLVFSQQDGAAQQLESSERVKIRTSTTRQK
jgi:serine/threonine protein kinase